MSGSALAISPASASKWTIISGPLKGSVKLMNTPQFNVGRSPECELVITNDPKCSRKHAQVVSNGHGCEVISLNEKNLVLVNGTPVEKASLNDGDVVSFGDTEVQYNETSVSTGSQLVLVQPQVAPYQANPSPYRQAPRPQPRPKSPSSLPTSNKRLYIYAALALILGWLILGGSKAKKKAVEIRNEQQIQADIESATKMREASETQALKRLDQTVTSRQAQENYVRGFRDYKKNQFERALTSFQACLALNPEHILCNRYLRLTQRKFDELIQYEMVLGRKYRDQNQYRACRASFRNVMVMVKDASSLTYQEAKANYEACDSLAEGRF